VAHRTFPDPVLRDQLFGDSGDSTALHARSPGNGSAGNGLVSPHQVQHNAAIYIAGRFTPGNLEVVEIYLSWSCLHRISSTYELIHFCTLVQRECSLDLEFRLEKERHPA
jgi:hypothetical protein